MEPFRSVTGIAAPMIEDDINTDRIVPITRARTLTPDYGALLFSRVRYRADGSEDPDFVLNREPFRQARILVAGRNFGCGSSREAAVWGLLAFGIRCIVARSYADIFRENCLKSGLLAATVDKEAADRLAGLVAETGGGASLTVDLTAQTIACPDGTTMAFDISPAEREALLEGLDDIGMTLAFAGDIAAWERRTAADAPWMQRVPRAGG